jgi:hypothetical protein
MVGGSDLITNSAQKMQKVVQHFYLMNLRHDGIASLKTKHSNKVGKQTRIK